MGLDWADVADLPLEEYLRRLDQDQHPCALLTMARNEAVMMPLFLRYYEQHFEPQDIFVLDHLTNDGSLDAGLDVVTLPPPRLGTDDMQGRRFVRIVLKEALPPSQLNRCWCPDDWRTLLVGDVQRMLLESTGYRAVLFVDTDEFIAVRPGHGLNLTEYIAAFASATEPSSADFVTCAGYEVQHLDAEGEPALDFTQPILEQRSTIWRNLMYCKPALTRAPQVWKSGFHAREDDKTNPDEQLLLVHLHRADRAFAEMRHRTYSTRSDWDPDQPWRPDWYTKDFCNNFWDRRMEDIWHRIPATFEPIPDEWQRCIRI